MSVKVEVLEGDAYLEEVFERSARKRGRPRKRKQDNWGMATPTQSNGDGGVTVVPQSQILQVRPVSQIQMSPENSIDSGNSLTINSNNNIQGEAEGVLSSPTDSCDEPPMPGEDGSPVETSYITVTASDAASDDVAHSYVQYVDGTGEQTLYTTSNGQMYPVYTVGDSANTMYTSTPGQYYTPGNTTPVTYTQVPNNGGGQSQLIGNTAYLIQQGVDPEHAILGTRASPQTVAADVAYLVNSSGGGGGGGGGSSGSGGDPDGAPNIVHATRVSPTTVQWLLENYETAEGVSLPRSTLYNHYLRHCYDNKLDPVNAASFGKLIRSVFLGLRTRRLGTRGNSKYHYYGIRVKAGSVLTTVVTDEGNGRGGKRFRAQAKQEIPDTPTHSAPVQNQEYLGDHTGAIPEFPEIELPTGVPLPGLCSLEDIDTFRSIYREHCEAFLDAIVNLEFATVESLWREFWRCQDNNNGDECEEEKYLSKTKLLVLCKFRPVQEFVKRVDFQFYQNLVQVLIPDVLRPIPSSLTQAIRNFAKGLESWLTAAMHGCPSEMVEIKVSAVAAFAQTLRRYTSLNHLAQAARAVLQNSVQINQMLTDLNRVDFHNVQEQASWVCQCDGALVARLEADFKSTLQQQNSLEQWASWLKAVVNTVLKPYHGRPNFTTAARQLLLKWSFYSSMVIRDLTLRSAASFGSFHLIRLLYDEYMFYLIEHQVALATGETPIAVMGEKSCGGVGEMLNGGGEGGGGGGAASGGGGLVITSADLHMAKRLKMS